MYVLSCYECSVEHIFRRRKTVKGFGRICPRCGGFLSSAPLAKYTITPPPDMKIVPVMIARVKEDETVIDRIERWMKK